jgi:hypothetical protein
MFSNACIAIPQSPLLRCRSATIAVQVVHQWGNSGKKERRVFLSQTTACTACGAIVVQVGSGTRL